ncbi:MAG: hypothetical protein ACRD2A_03625 [Vicinamibacterales bacterium]
MTSTDLDEARTEQLTRLPILMSDSRRAERTGRRCRALLGSRRRRQEHLRSRFDIAQRGLEQVVVGAFCLFYVAYVTALVATTFRLQGLLH